MMLLHSTPAHFSFSQPFFSLSSQSSFSSNLNHSRTSHHLPPLSRSSDTYTYYPFPSIVPSLASPAATDPHSSSTSAPVQSLPSHPRPQLKNASQRTTSPSPTAPAFHMQNMCLTTTHALAAASYGPELRNLRRIASVEIFSPARIRSLSSLFSGEVGLMVKELFTYGSNDKFTRVDMQMKFSELMFNIIMKIIAGKRCVGVNRDCDLEEGNRFQRVIEELFDAVDAAHPEDFLPFLKWFGFNGLRNRMARLRREIDQLFQELIEERRKETGEKGTVIDVLLSLQEKDGEHYSDELIKGMTLTLVAAGTHTTSRTMEWAMSLLLNHPEALQMVKNEIDKQVGQDRLAHHLDVQNLDYLNNVIKETLRLFPTVPLLQPHESSNECTVEGFSIPSGAMLFANAYAIHRDPEVWTEPTAFKPERFEERGGLHASKIYFPFGLGRRSCPGEGLAMQVVGLALGALIQCFEWERIGKEKVDMTEGSGITMPKAMPLEAMYRPRQGIVDVLNSL